MAVDLQIKSGDTRNWRFALQDSTSTAVNLTDAKVKFSLKWNERDPDDYFVRVTGAGGTNSDYIKISDAANGIVTVTPRLADWTGLSDNYGIYVGEFRVSDANDDYQFTQDITLDFQRPVVS